MVLKLFGSARSTATRRVAFVLHEKKVPFELVPVNFMTGEHKSPSHLKQHPFGQVPYLDDDGFILYESRAICRYVEDKYPDQGTRLIPTDLRARALFEQAASVELNNFEPFAGGAVREAIFKSNPSQATFDNLIATLSQKLDAYDAILAKQKYLAGDEVTLADLFHVPYATLLETAGSNIMNSRPNVARWLTDLINRPAWLAVKDGAKSIANY